MYEFLKSLSDKDVCQSMGICSIDPTVSALEELMTCELREMSFYIVKLHELGEVNKEIESHLARALSIIMINTSFNKEEFKNYLKKLCQDKQKIKDKYVEYCKYNHVTCELIGLGYDLCEDATLSDMTKQGEFKMQNKYKNIPIERQRLLELITLFSKTTAIVLDFLKKVKEDTSEYDFELIRFFSLTNLTSTRCEKLKRRILEFSKIAYKIQEETNYLYEKRYGKRQSTRIQLSGVKGKSILVSGPDLVELEKVLDTIGEREINVYTNSMMFIAHTYPKFKKYKKLIGQIGTSDVGKDFSDFPGAILITQNFLQKIDNVLRGVIYSNKIITPSRIFKIKDDNYEPLIESALNLEGYLENENKKSVDIIHDFDEIENTLKSLEKKEVVVVVGEENTKENILEFNDKKIINLSCPIESDLIIFTLNKCQELNIKTDLFFTSCSISSINTLMSTLFMELNGIWLTNCSSSFINPHVSEALSEDFGVNIIS